MATTLTTEHPYTGDGSTTNYSFSFPYLKEADVKVTLDHVATTAYTFANASTISFTTAPANGVGIRIFRDTDVDAARFVFSSGSALKSGELNENLDQLLYADQERASTDNIADQAVTTAKLRDEAVTVDKLGASAIITAKIADSSITTAKIADSSVTTEKIADSSIVSAKYANESVGSAALAASGVTEAKLASNSVTTDKIVDNSVTLAKLNSGALPTDITIASANIIDGTIATIDIADDAINNAKIATDAVNADSVQDGTLSSAKLTAATVVTNTEQAASTPNDTSFFTTSASDGRYFRQDSTETITSGVTWTSDNARVATTAAIDARIVDLVEEVGGFVPIANETSFPAANPDVNNGAGTIVSVSAIGTSRTPSSGSVTIADGAGTGNTVTITGVGSQELTSGFGMLLETTSTLHTYTFHRLTPPATNVNTVATNIADVNTVAGNNANVTTVANINSDVTTVATNNTNVTAVGTDIANVNTAAGSIANINTVASDLNEATSEIDTVATNIANVNAVGTDITNVNTVATNLNSVNSFADVYRVAASDPTTSLDTGDLVFNTTNNALRVYNGTSWQDGVTAGGNFMSKTGDAMSGNLNMQNNKVENLANATANGDAVSKSFMDTAIDTALTTDVIGGQSITVTDNSPGSGQISVSVTGGSIGPTQLANTAVTAGTYGSTSTIPSFTVDSDGRITNVTTNSITKLDGIESGATADQTDAEIRAAVEAATDSNVFTDADHTKLNGIEAGATANPDKISEGNTEAEVVDTGSDGHFKVTTEGSERLRIDSSGFVGINVTPSAHLHVGGTIQSSVGGSYAQMYATGGSANFASVGAYPAIFRTNGAERMRIDSSGNLGLGTSSPQSSLSVAGSIPNAPSTEGVHLGLTSNYAVMQLSGNTGGIIDFAEAGVDNAGRIIYTHSTDAMQFSTAASTRMTIDSSGNVGIGTSSPNVYGVHANNSSNSVYFKAESGSVATVYGSATALSTGVFGTFTNHALAAYTNSVERLRIDASGRLLLGTSTARDKFFGNLALPLQVEGSTTPACSLAITRNDATADSSKLVLAHARGTGYQILQNNDAIGDISWQGADGSKFVQAASIRAFVDSTPGSDDMPGRIVFSTTADGASSPTERLRITSTGAIAINGASNYGTSGQVLTSTGNSAPTWQAASAFEAGMIMMYTGSSAPTGWAICNGSNGTPDLRDRFIVGSGSTYSAGSTGGSADATIPSHSHTYSYADDLTNSRRGGIASYYANTTYDVSHSTQNTSTVGASATNANLPPYYALMFIMKT